MRRFFDLDGFHYSCSYFSSRSRGGDEGCVGERQTAHLKAVSDAINPFQSRRAFRRHEEEWVPPHSSTHISRSMEHGVNKVERTQLAKKLNVSHNPAGAWTLSWSMYSVETLVRYRGTPRDVCAHLVSASVQLRDGLLWTLKLSSATSTDESLEGVPSLRTVTVISEESWRRQSELYMRRTCPLCSTLARRWWSI